MNDIHWPHWVGRREQITLESIVRLIESVRSECRGERNNRQGAVRDVVRNIGFNDRNSVGVLADLIERSTLQTS